MAAVPPEVLAVTGELHTGHSLCRTGDLKAGALQIHCIFLQGLGKGAGSRREGFSPSCLIPERAGSLVCLQWCANLLTQVLE